MAIYQTLGSATIQRCAMAFGLGEVLSSRGEPAGSVHTIYEVVTPRGRFALRYVNQPDETWLAALRYEAALMDHLQQQGFPCPAVAHMADGDVLWMMDNAAIQFFTWLPGRHVLSPDLTPDLCDQAAFQMGRMHVLGRGLDLRGPDLFSLQQVDQWINEPLFRTSLPERHFLAIRRACDELLAHAPAETPGGAIHADLFPDNVLYENGRLTGIIDFGAACTGRFIDDLATFISSWAWRADHLDWERTRAIASGYRRARIPAPEEAEEFSWAFRKMSLRFTVTRVRDFHMNPAPPESRVHKDYLDYLRCLTSARENGERIAALLRN
ncbi:MAG: Homoserine kinase [Myxococcota bacterium]|nr:Homoserine kinase [Myxococcota bacterium]